MRTAVGPYSSGYAPASCPQLRSIPRARAHPREEDRWRAHWEWRAAARNSRGRAPSERSGAIDRSRRHGFQTQAPACETPQVRLPFRSSSSPGSEEQWAIKAGVVPRAAAEGGTDVDIAVDLFGLRVIELAAQRWSLHERQAADRGSPPLPPSRCGQRYGLRAAPGPDPSWHASRRHRLRPRDHCAQRPRAH